MEHLFPGVDVPLRVDKSTNILEVLKLATRTFDQATITLASTRAYKESNHLRVDSEPNAKVPKESVHSTYSPVNIYHRDCINTSDLMDISPSLFKDSPIYQDIESTNNLSQNMLNRSIEKIIESERLVDELMSSNKPSQVTEESGLYKRYKEYKKDNGKEASNALVFDDVRKQIPEEVTDITLRKRMERTRKNV
ncbi:11096_t:CDS:2 [Ambispora gerdemannii]|uniref:11096_t:CDS:1 n=1 Tax=Ambispora gerdemannii TaxID=144530 RepID=A0A9N9BQA9_9GLOM|nr:11096_t:CDS:2 [Ambispora gerdemannii]